MLSPVVAFQDLIALPFGIIPVLEVAVKRMSVPAQKVGLLVMYVVGLVQISDLVLESSFVKLPPEE